MDEGFRHVSFMEGNFGIEMEMQTCNRKWAERITKMNPSYFEKITSLFLLLFRFGFYCFSFFLTLVLKASHSVMKALKAWSPFYNLIFD